MVHFTEDIKYKTGILKTLHQLEELMQEEGKTETYRVLSFGGGTQSSHLLEAHLRGEIHYDYIVFTDTGAEPRFIHEQVSWWISRQKQMGNHTPFLIARHGSMPRGLEEMLMRYIFTDYNRFQMPLFFNRVNEEGNIIPAGMMPRQCTGDFKITPAYQAIQREIKASKGLQLTQKMPRNIGIIMDIGFSSDEINRVAAHRSFQCKYVYLNYPLIEANISTQTSINFLNENDFPSARSRCYFCPFNCDGERAKEIGMDWREIIEKEPLSFLKACFFDEELRTRQATGTKNMTSIPYFHKSREPLKEVYKADYLRLTYEFEDDLSIWLKEWSDYLSLKYAEFTGYPEHILYEKVNI